MTTNSLAPILERANITYRMRHLRTLIVELETDPPSVERDAHLDALRYELDTLRHQFVFLIITDVIKH